MDRAPAAIVQTDEAVVHVVGTLTEPAFGFVGSTTQALGDNGVPQALILIRTPPDETMLAKFHPSVRLKLPPRGAGPVRQFKLAVRRLCHETKTRSVAAIHLHGFLPCLIAIYAVWFCGLSPRLFLLPRGSRVLWLVRGASTLLMRARHPFFKRRPAAGGAAPSGLDDGPDTQPQPIRLVERPVDGRFFNWDRQESRRPLIVAGSAMPDREGAAHFAQLAVLLGEDSMALSFNWVGPVDEDSRARLKAANVGIFHDDDPQLRAAKLAGAWLYVAYGNSTAFPVLLSEAMALGLACVATDTPQNRAVLSHGETGLLCSGPSQLLASVAQLIDSPELRRNMGRAAQQEAERRFHPAKVRELIHSPA